jgi:hypothetical protein
VVQQNSDKAKLKKFGFFVLEYLIEFMEPTPIRASFYYLFVYGTHHEK